MELPAATRRRPTHWKTRTEARLIQLYGDNSVLWDTRHPNYYKPERREQAIAAIADAMGSEFDVVAVKDKIKTLRDYFVKEVKKVETSRKTAGLGYMSRWEHYDTFGFLRTSASRECRQSLASNSTAYPIKLEIANGGLQVIERNEAMIVPTLTTADTSSGESRTPSMFPNKYCGRTLTRPEHEGPSVTITPLALPLAKKPRLSVDQKYSATNGTAASHDGVAANVQQFRFPARQIMAASNVANVAPLAPQNVPRASEREGDDDLFFQQVMSELKKMCPYQRDLCKLRIRQVMFEAKHGAYY